VLIIAVYGLPVTSKYETYCSITQYNKVEENTKSIIEHRTEILEDIKKHVKSVDNTNDVVIVGDLNQFIRANKIQVFFNEVGVRDVHSTINQIEMRNIDNTFIRGSKLIDTITMSNGIIQYIKECRLIEENAIVLSDHHVYLVDVNLEQYFSKQFSSWDGINRSVLNSARRSHREKFVQVVEQQLDVMHIENEIDEAAKAPSQERLE